MTEIAAELWVQRVLRDCEGNKSRVGCRDGRVSPLDPYPQKVSRAGGRNLGRVRTNSSDCGKFQKNYPRMKYPIENAPTLFRH